MEETSLNEVERSSGVRNATILVALAGLVLIYSGYRFYEISIMIPTPINFIIGMLMIVFGIASLCTSLLVWMQKSWAPTLVTGVGIVVCGTFVIFGFLLPVVIFALWFWAARDYIKDNRAPQLSESGDI